MYEVYIAVGSASLTIGLMLGHWLGKSESKLEYERGYLDAVWNIWCASIKRSFESTTAETKASSTDSSNADIH
jgi:hypothetical protein